MRTTIIDRADFVYIADLDPITAPAGHYSLLLSTIWRHARNPRGRAPAARPGHRPRRTDSPARADRSGGGGVRG